MIVTTKILIKTYTQCHLSYILRTLLPLRVLFTSFWRLAVEVRSRGHLLSRSPLSWRQHLSQLRQPSWATTKPYISYERTSGTESIIRIPPTSIVFSIDIKYRYIDMKSFYVFRAFKKLPKWQTVFGVAFRRCPVGLSEGTLTILTKCSWFLSVSPRKLLR
jgi:hypothetical protein